MKDEFLSEGDLDLRNLSHEELIAVWNAWLLQAQATNDVDEHLYSHGVFREVPLEARRKIERSETEEESRD
jgi:hypothetical protein